MSVADLTLATYALLTVVSIFAVGRLWGAGAEVGRSRLWLATVWAAAEVLLLTYYLVWTDDRFHRAGYMIMNTAVGGVVVAGLAVVLLALKRRKGRAASLFAVLLGLVGVLAAGTTMVTRTLFWPPFAFLAFCLLLAPLLALVPRLTVRGYQVRRDPDLFGWLLMVLFGVLTILEAATMVGLVPGTAWFGRPSLLSFFLAGTVVVVLLARPAAPTMTPRPSGTGVPWHLFNPPLSPREADLVEGLKRRLTNKELASEAGVSESTVKKHLVSLFRKAGVESRQELFERLDGAK